MSTKLQFLHELLNRLFSNRAKSSKGGKPKIFSDASFVLFFMVVFYKRIHSFKAMSKYVEVHFIQFGFPKPPSRKTIRRRFLALPLVLKFLMPRIAEECKKLDFATFGFSFAFIDKSVFRALGGIWHKKDMIINRVPHKSIDTDGSWAKSAYHSWRFGYGLHVICNQNRFPINAWVTTASVKDHTLLETLIEPLNQYIGIVVGDRGYFAFRSMQNVYKKWKILVQTPSIYENLTQKAKDTFKHIYNNLVKTTQAGWLYKKRKPSIEPLFSNIKELFELQGNKQLPFQKLSYVQPFLLITVVTVQLMMYDNFKNKRGLGENRTFLSLFR